jgi:ribosomal protein L7/L12
MSDLIDTYLEQHKDNDDVRIREFYMNKGKIAAIKYCRSISGFQLGEAKEYVELICSDIRPASIVPEWREVW